MKKLENKIRGIIKTVFVFLLFWYSFYLKYIPVYLFHLDVKHLSTAMQVILSTFSSILLLFILFFIYRKDLKIEFKKFRKKYIDYMDIGLKYWAIGLVVMYISNFIITFIFKAGGANNEEIVQSMIKSLPLLMLIDAGFIAPINEELVFRKSLKDVINNKWVFAFVSFLLFGIAHVVSNSATPLDYLYIIPYGALGAAFAMAYYKTDTVFTSISLHILHNFILIVLSIAISLV